MGNELKLLLENFQSISRGELIFSQGTNVIIGQSNSGKTATFRALKACLSNPTGSQRFIKKGTSHASVTLEYNGNQIIWKRTPKENSYIINGEEYLKTGKSNAFKLTDDTGFVVDDNDTIMNIEEELQLPFPFGIPKSELFKLYENVFCVSDSAVILKAAKEKEEETKSQISSIETEITKNSNKLSEIKEFKEQVDLELLKEKKKFFKSKQERIYLLKDGIDIIHRAAKIENFKVDESSFTNKLSNFNDLQNLKQALLKLKKLHALGKELKEIKEVAPINLIEYKELKNLRKICSTIYKLKDMEAPLETFINKLENYNELIAYKNSLKNLKESLKEKKEKLEELNLFLQEKENKLKEFKVCPLCHKPID